MMKDELKENPTEFRTQKLLKDLPAHLKDYRNYHKIRKFLLDILGGKHSHSEMKQWSNCKQCMEKVHNLNMARKKLGFKNPAQYLAWQKVMDFIHNPKYSPLRPNGKYIR